MGAVGAQAGALAPAREAGGDAHNSHVHYHVLVTDGVFSDGGQNVARLHPSAGVATADVATVQHQIRRRGLRWLHRHGLERLVRYCARPPLAQQRLGRLDDEYLVYRLRKPTMDGQTELIFTPLQLLDSPRVAGRSSWRGSSSICRWCVRTVGR